MVIETAVPMQQAYRYVGPKPIAERASRASMGVRIDTPDDVWRWLQQTKQELQRGSVTVTFVVDEAGALRIADRRSEHVACAGGRPVRAAGELTLMVASGNVRVTGVTNQSTGYCPEPESWPAVRAALERAGLEAPEGFSQEFVFRRCPGCGAINIIKERILECSVCSASLPAAWNLAPDGTAEPRSAC
jgi:hypothetical protein